jgi:hypothetical protein
LPILVTTSAGTTTAAPAFLSSHQHQLYQSYYGQNDCHIQIIPSPSSSHQIDFSIAPLLRKPNPHHSTIPFAFSPHPSPPKIPALLALASGGCLQFTFTHLHYQRTSIRTTHHGLHFPEPFEISNFNSSHFFDISRHTRIWAAKFLLWHELRHFDPSEAVVLAPFDDASFRFATSHCRNAALWGKAACEKGMTNNSCYQPGKDSVISYSSNFTGFHFTLAKDLADSAGY